MGWFWDTKPNNNATASNDDAYSKLDPGLRDFLDQQTPVDPPTAQPSTTPNAPPEQPYRSQFGFTDAGLNPNQQSSVQNEQDKPAVPPESLYQDGRYAHLWKSYRPQSEILAATQSDQDKLASIYDSLSNRKAAIGRAALENCVEEQMAEKYCYSHGTITQRLTMCRTESRQFHRCFSMQSRFLKALGYLSSTERTNEEEERIQMHADRLYHEMLERERIIEEAQESGAPKPSFEPLIKGNDTTQALGEQSAWARARQKAQADKLPSSIDDFPPEKQKEIRGRIKGLSELERDVELQLIAGENRAIAEYAEMVDRQLQEEKVRRDERRETGKETVGDSIKRMWGYAMSLADTPVGTSQGASAPQQNLPLPRELRDQIWGYLLRHEHVREGPYRDRPMDKRGKISGEPIRDISRAHTFKFHTNILAVNRHIQEECLKMLKSNEFVIISNRGVVDPEVKHITSIPIITENHSHCAQFKHHVLRVHVQASTGLIKNCGKGKPSDLKVFCVVAADLPRFCKALRLHVLITPCPAKFLYSSEGVTGVEDPVIEVDANSGEDVYVRTNIRFEGTEMSASRARQLLNAFRCIVQGKQRVIISNAPDGIAQEVQQLKDIMGPQTIWINAQAWFALQTLRDEVTEIEASVRAGDLENAVARSAEAALLAQVPSMLAQPVQAYSSEAALPFVLLVHTLLDAAVTESQLRIRLGGQHLQLVPLLRQHLMGLVDWLQSTPAMATAKLTEEAWPTTCRALWATMMIAITSDHFDQAMSGLESFEDELQTDAYSNHDMSLLREVKNNKKLRAKLLRKDGVTSDFLKRTSACQLPPRCYRNPYIDSFQPPSGLEGYVDRTRVAKLKEEYPGRYDYL